MSIDADWLVDRRRLKKRLRWWQVGAVLAAVLAVVAFVGRFDAAFERPHVARIDVYGLIVDDSDRDRLLAEVARDDAAAALIVRIDSPGGTVVGGEVLYRGLRRVAERKPVVAVLGELATSAGYMTAIGSDWIIAHDGTLTGSVGVIIQSADFTGLMDKLGIKPEAVKSTPLKAQPNPLEPFTPEAREAIRKVVDDVYAMFKDMVQERRQLDPEQLAAVTDGAIFTGRQALANGLVDALGGEVEARDWLERARGVSASLPTRDLEIPGPERELADLLGTVTRKMLFAERLSLDGLVSVWHPSH